MQMNTAAPINKPASVDNSLQLCFRLKLFIVRSDKSVGTPAACFQLCWNVVTVRRSAIIDCSSRTQPLRPWIDVAQSQVLARACIVQLLLSGIYFAPLSIVTSNYFVCLLTVVGVQSKRSLGASPGRRGQSRLCVAN